MNIFSLLKIPRNKITKTAFFVVSDIVLVLAAFFLSFMIRFDGNINIYTSAIIQTSLLAVVFILPIFYLNGLYSFTWAYVSADELISLFKANTISFVFLGFALFFSKDFAYFENFPRSTLFISYVLTFILCGGVRLSKRIYFQIVGFKDSSNKENTLIVGAGDSGEQIVRSILSSKNSSYYPIGLVDDNQIKQKVAIHGLKVLGKIKDIPRIVKDNKVSQLIITLPSSGDNTIKQAIDLANSVGVKKIKITPPLSEIINQEVSFRNLKDVDVSDLLGRDAIDIDSNSIKDFISGKKILITGSGGSIGSELSRQVANFHPSLLLLLDQDETATFNILKELSAKHHGLKLETIIADVTDDKKIKKVFDKFNPEVVFHAAAYKHVPLMEDNIDQAIKNNILGTKILAENSINHSVGKFVFISTDKAINPSSVMGKTKRVGEMLCQLYNQKNVTKFISVRFGNVLDSRGSVVPIFREQIKKGGPVEVTHPDMKRYFMLIPEACLLVMQASAMGQGGEVFVLDMGEPVKIIDLAREMIRLSGFEPDKDIAITFTGTRPGEKLFEEMLTTHENASLTKNKKIFMAKLKDIEGDNFEGMIDELEKNLHEKEANELANMLEDIVSFYH